MDTVYTEKTLVFPENPLKVYQKLSIQSLKLKIEISYLDLRYGIKYLTARINFIIAKISFSTTYCGGEALNAYYEIQIAK